MYWLVESPIIIIIINQPLFVSCPRCLMFKTQKIMLKSCEITTKSPFSSSTNRAVDQSATAHHFPPGHGTGTTNKAICVEEPTETPMAKSNFLAETRNPPHAPKRVKSREISWNLVKSLQKEFLLAKGHLPWFSMLVCLSMCFAFKIPKKNIKKHFKNRYGSLFLDHLKSVFFPP